MTIRIASLQLMNDREGGLGGAAPAEVVPQVEVRYDPYTGPTFGTTVPVIVHELRVDHRSSPVLIAAEGEMLSPDLLIYEGPVFDGQTTVDLALELREVDRYPTHGIAEPSFGDGDQLAIFTGPVTIADGTFTIESEHARATIDVDVTTLY